MLTIYNMHILSMENQCPAVSENEPSPHFPTFFPITGFFVILSKEQNMVSKHGRMFSYLRLCLQIPYIEFSEKNIIL